MCQDCERYEKDAIKANQEDWVTLATLIQNARAVFINVLGTPVAVSLFDIRTAVDVADKNTKCPSYLEDTPLKGEIVISMSV